MSRSPVLLIAFNRPDFTANALDSIVRAKPPVLYVACDGPRTEDERHVVEETHRVVRSATEGVVQLRTLFRDHNLGCKRGVESAISWFFEQEREGVILEDDCIATPAFFRFADEMLGRYRDDPVVMHVGGYCHTSASRPGYRYSRFPAVWGWATWSRAWAKYSEVLPEMTPERRRDLRAAFASDDELNFFADKWTAVRDGRLDTWDYSWFFALTAARGLAVQPCENLVRNLGVGDLRAAHTTRARSGAFERASDPALELLVIAPQFRVPDFELDQSYFSESIDGRFHTLKRVRRLALYWMRHLDTRVARLRAGSTVRID